jgi:KAP family P-loop domain
MLKIIQKLFNKVPSQPNQVQNRPPPSVSQQVTSSSKLYLSDLPISSKSEDRFNRWHFAKRIADTLANDNDPSSLVIGLYGPWGDGKTSTLQLMAYALRAQPQAVVVRFNPWYFQTEEKLITGFFSVLAESLGKSLPNRKEVFGEILTKYGSILSLASIAIGGVVTINAKEAAKGFGEALSTVSLDELRERLEKALEESGKKVVVMIDDIDRLDKIETHALLKLVKLSAGFKHTRYILSFDDEMVAAAIGERYGRGNYEAGRSFLEKIIQVPLHLPPADIVELRRMTLEGVQAVLNQSDIGLTQEQADAYGRHFVDGLEPGLDTPRRGKVYVNALTFSLPLLKGEVDPVDLMLIEGIRVFYPKLYFEIRDNEDLFLNASAHDQDNQIRHQLLADIVNEGLVGRNEREKSAIKRGLLNVLSPRVSNMGYGPEWDRIWTQKQRICSDQYFKRYFSYAIPPGDIGDLEVTQFLELLAARATEQQDADLRAYAERNSFPQLITKLREREEHIDPAIARILALALARNGALARKERGLLFATTDMQAAILISHLLKRVLAGQEREQLAMEVIQCAEPLTFAFECTKWIRHTADRPEADRIVSADCEEDFKKALSDRIQDRANQEPLYLSFGSGTYALYWLWNDVVGGTAVGDHLKARFTQNPNEVDIFLDTFVGEAWGLETGLPHKSDFTRDSYNVIAQWLDPEVIISNLRTRYGDEIDTAQYHYGDEVPIARRIALQFAFIHRNVVAEGAQADLVQAPDSQGRSL